MRAIARRLRRLENRNALSPAAQRFRVQFGYLKTLPDDYTGPRHTVTVRQLAADSEGHDRFDWEEQPGLAPAANATGSSDEVLIRILLRGSAVWQAGRDAGKKMKAINRRLCQLEEQFHPADFLPYPRTSLRLVVRRAGHTAYRVPSCCRRTLCPNVMLMEPVVIDDGAALSYEEFEKFKSAPIQTSAESGQSPARNRNRYGYTTPSYRRRGLGGASKRRLKPLFRVGDHTSRAEDAAASAASAFIRPISARYSA